MSGKRGRCDEVAIAERDSIEDDNCEIIDLAERMHNRVAYGEVLLFFKQDTAVAHMKSHAAGAVFCKENEKGEGKRYYLCGAWRKFHQMYVRDMKPAERCYYEMLLPGEKPGELGVSHMYADLDFEPCLNPGVDFLAIEKELRGLFMDYYRDNVPRLLGLELSDIEPVEENSYDSSDAKKFSRHWLIKCRQSMFYSPADVGAVVRCFERMILDKHGAPEFNKFYIWTSRRGTLADGTKVDLTEKQFLMDMSVYTRYRPFRIPFSSKLGKNRFFTKVGWKGPIEDYTLEMFLADLIQYTPDAKVRVIRGVEPNGEKAVFTSIKQHHHMFDHAKVPTPHLLVTEKSQKSNGEFCGLIGVPITPSSGGVVPEVVLAAGRMIMSGQPKSDSFRAYWYFDTTMGCKFQSYDRTANPCPFVNRPHKHNHICYHLDVMNEVGELDISWSVSCYDQLCCGKRSEKKRLSKLPRGKPDDIKKLEANLTAFFNETMKASITDTSDFMFVI